MSVKIPDRLVSVVKKLFPSIDGDTIVAWVRTVVPVFVGSLLVQLASIIPAVTTWLDNMYLGWQAAVGGFSVVIVTGAYYAIARKVEAKYPMAGKWLLGSASKPVYIEPYTPEAYDPTEPKA